MFYFFISVTDKNICYPLPNPVNGKYLPDIKSPIGMLLVTTCNAGYHVSSKGIVMCTKPRKGDGNSAAFWSPDPPTCGKIFYHPFHELINQY